MRWVFAFIGFCLLYSPALASERLEPIKACPLKRLSNPISAASTVCTVGHCIDLDHGRSICKCAPENGEGKASLHLINQGKSEQTWSAGDWPSGSYLGRTDDFEVLSGDLRGNNKTEWIIANHEGSSQGVVVHFWRLYVLNPSDPSAPPISWLNSDYGPGSFALPSNTDAKGCDILMTYWREGHERGRNKGLYFVGSWFRLGFDKLELHPTRRKRLRRYLYSFALEQARDSGAFDTDKGISFPAKWLRPTKAFFPKPHLHIEDSDTVP